MASSLTLDIIAKLDPKGFNDLAKYMEDVKNQTQAASGSAIKLADSFSALKNAVVGGVLTLPLINFTREAIRSEDVTARFRLQLESLNQSISQSQIDELAQKTRRFGIAETEMVQGLAQGLTYLKTTTNEMRLLDTAIGMTVLKGISLGQAFQQIGMIQLGNTRILRQYGITLDTSIKDPTDRTAKAIEELRKKMEPMAKESGTLASEMKKAGATIGDIGEKIASSLLPPITAVLKAFNSLSDSTKQTILTIGLVGTTILGVSKILLALQAITARFAVTSGVAAVSTGSLTTAIGIMGPVTQATSLEIDRLAMSIGVAIAAEQKAITSTVIFGKTIANANIIFLAASVIIGALWSIYSQWKDKQDKATKAREDQTIADAAGVKQLQANIEILKEEITTDDDKIAKLKELKEASQGFLDARTTAIQKGSKLEAESAENFRQQAEVKIKTLERLQEAEKASGKITTEEAQKMANVRNFGGETEAEIMALTQLRNGYRDVFGEKSLAALAADDKIKDSERKLRQERTTTQKELLSIQGDLAKKAISEETNARRLGRESFAIIDKEQTAKMLAVELQLKKAELNQEAAALSKEWAKNAELKKAFVQKEEAALRDIRIAYARAALDKELELALMTAEERAKYDEEQARARQILGRVSSVDQIGKLSDEEKTLLKTMQDQSILEAKMAELAKERQKATEEEWKTRINFTKTGMASRVPLTESELAQKDVEALGVNNKALGVKLTTDTNVTLTVSNPGELADKVSTAVVGAIKPYFEEAAKEAARQTALMGNNLKQG